MISLLLLLKLLASQASVLDSLRELLDVIFSLLEEAHDLVLQFASLLLLLEACATQLAAEVGFELFEHLLHTVLGVNACFLDDREFIVHSFLQVFNVLEVALKFLHCLLKLHFS